MDDIRQFLDSLEYRVYILLKQGKTYKEITKAEGVKEENITVAKVRKIETKCNVFIHLKQGKTYEQIAEEENISLRSISRIHAAIKNHPDNMLTGIEQKIVQEKANGKTNGLIAKDLELTRNMVKKTLCVTRKKYPESIDDLFKPSINLESFEPDCNNCHYFLQAFFHNGTKTIHCQISGSIICSSNKNHSCDWHKKRQEKLQEKDILQEKLNDQGYLKMANMRYRYGYEPTETLERIQYGIAQLGDGAFLMAKKAEHLVMLAHSARYPVVPLTTKQRKNPAVKYILKDFKLNPIKTDFDEDENGARMTTAYYVIKNYSCYVRLMKALHDSENIIISIPEEKTLSVEFRHRVIINSINIREENQKTWQPLSLDQKTSSKHHSTEFTYGPGKYILSITIGDGRWSTRFNYGITVSNENGKSKISHKAA